MSPADPRGPGARVRTERRVLIFLHIGKTAGSTLRTVIHRNYSSSDVSLIRSEPEAGSERPRRERTVRDFAGLPEEVRARPRVFEGHIIFGIHEYVPHPSTYITILRDPVKLAVSQYNYVRRRQDHRLHA